MEKITPKSKNLSAWYNDVILKAQLADYGQVRGTMVIRPYGFAIWENIKKELNLRIENEGVKNAYFPLLAPYSNFQKEKEHIEGFSPELAIVTHGGGKELAEKLVIRPTSEAIIYPLYAKWIHSYRDLPLKINQWVNIVRWEKRTYLFLRTMEFLWQEGHNVFSSEDECQKDTIRMLNVYKKFAEDALALPVFSGPKTEFEKFAGSKTTYAVEAVMPDGKALQAGTSHNLSDKFSKAFDIKYQNKEGKEVYAYQNSWGVSTRIMGGAIMAHGDDKGLVLPPSIAPIKVVVVPIKAEEKFIKYARKVQKVLTDCGISSELDLRDTVTVGFKFNEWELKGVPLRMEIGEKEMRDSAVTIVPRISEETSYQKKIAVSSINREVPPMLEKIQSLLYKRAVELKDSLTFSISSYEEFKDQMKKRKVFARVFWAGSTEDEVRIKEKTKCTIRVLENSKVFGRCFYTGRETNTVAYFAQSY